MMTELSRDEVQNALEPMLAILREADDSRPLAQYIVDLVKARTSKQDAENEGLLAATEFLNRRYERLLEVIESRAKSQDWSDWNFEARYDDDAAFDTMWRERLEKMGQAQ